MGNGRLFRTETSDQMIFGQEMVSMLSVTLIAVILHWTITSFKKDYSLTASKSMRVPCLLSIISFLVMNVVGMIGWNNVFIPISSITCKIIYPFCLLSYNFGKIAMYYLFTFRVELIFKHTNYELSAVSLTVYRVFCFVVPTVLWSIWVYLSWDDIKPHPTDTSDSQYQYCFPVHWKEDTLASQHKINFYLAEHIMASIAICDLIFSAIPLMLFIYKYCQVTSLYRTSKIITNINDNGDLYQALSNPLQSNVPAFELKHIAIIRKSTMLVLIAIVSTWLFLIGSSYIYRQIGFYLPFDGVINSLCIACLFQFGDDFYAVTFARLECCCLCFGKSCNKCPCLCCGDLSLLLDDEHDKPDARENDDNANGGAHPISFTSTSSAHKNGNNAIQYHAKIHSHRKDGAEAEPEEVQNAANAHAGLLGGIQQSNVIKIQPKAKQANRNRHGLGLISSWKNTPTATGTYPSRINIHTPTQRYQGSPEQRLFVEAMGKSITEFMPMTPLDPARALVTPPRQDGVSPPQTDQFVEQRVMENMNAMMEENEEKRERIEEEEVEDEDTTPQTNQDDLVQYSHIADSDITDSHSINMHPANKTGAITVIKKNAKPSKIGRF
eukprot:CAMPEP_0197038134 /NCGR_PEP_ID=MMETSP1384-20130603/15139_1 /TAXON_ID=29189 /ORGANISM="Ammonia sp." /LENGTH=608 /DNA_ID=CAMNT_0042468529 /DNA_START=126 /DNA_END=1952 /DNA_ORIENTATION=-